MKWKTSCSHLRKIFCSPSNSRVDWNQILTSLKKNLRIISIIKWCMAAVSNWKIKPTKSTTSCNNHWNKSQKRTRISKIHKWPFKNRSPNCLKLLTSTPYPPHLKSNICKEKSETTQTKSNTLKLSWVGRAQLNLPENPLLFLLRTRRRYPV